jgi:hypothetical protein
MPHVAHPGIASIWQPRWQYGCVPEDMDRSLARQIQHPTATAFFSRSLRDRSGPKIMTSLAQQNGLHRVLHAINRCSDNGVALI